LYHLCGLTSEPIAFSKMDDLVQSTAFTPLILGTMQSSCQIFLFGDLTVSFEEDLRQLLHVKDNAILHSFFEQASFAFRAECAKLPAHQQAWFPRFTTIIDLLSKLGETEGTPALRFALLCLCEIGQFLRSDSVSNTLSRL
jgi:Starter unit:ACP transacylase in aflatoxin biosynthesis